MHALKESERITLAEGLKLLERELPADEAKACLRQAFIQKAFSQQPLFALPYDEADVDWATGSVEIPRKRDRFCPSFLRADFNAYFFEEQTAAPGAAFETNSPPQTKEILTLKPTFCGMSVDLKELWRRFAALWKAKQ